MNACRLLLADDHTLVRAGIRSLIEGLDGMEIVAEAENGPDAVALAKSTRPDLAVMDISMSGLSGIEATLQIKEALPAVRVLIISMHTADDMVRRALGAGASGYLVKSSAPLELRMAIEAILRGEIFVSSRVSRALLPARTDGASTTPGASIDVLTSRQREILQLIAEGKSTKQISFSLKLSGKTVDSHKAAIMDRLGIRDIAGLVIFAVRNKLVDLDRPGS